MGEGRNLKGGELLRGAERFKEGVIAKKEALRKDHNGRGGALVASMTFNRTVVGSTPSLAAIYACRDLYLQLPVCLGVKLRYSLRAVAGSASE